jgi:hypothetical protein
MSSPRRVSPKGSVVVGDQGSCDGLAGGAVVPDGGGEGEQTLGDAGGDPGEGGVYQRSWTVTPCLVDLSMPEQRRKLSPQFGAGAVQMVLETGKPIAEVARDLEINEGTPVEALTDYRAAATAAA